VSFLRLPAHVVDRPAELIVQRDTHDVVGKMGVSNLTGTNHPHSIAVMKRYKGKFLDGCESHGRAPVIAGEYDPRPVRPRGASANPICPRQCQSSRRRIDIFTGRPS